MFFWQVLLLIIDIGASWLRMFVALGVSIIFSIAVGIYAATDKRMERILLPTIDVLQTIPILGFFPVVIYLVILLIPNFIGVNIAVIFLIFTSMSWNITFGVYEAAKSIPNELLELARLNHFSKIRMLSDVYIPASLPRIAYQSVISWSIGLFYLITSEIFSTGSENFAVKYGIGVEIANLAASNNMYTYAIAILFFVVAVILTRILFLSPFSAFSERFSFKESAETKKSRRVSFYSHLYKASYKLFYLVFGRFDKPMVHDRRKMSEKPAAGKRGINYNVIIVAVVAAAFVAVVFSYNLVGYLPSVILALIFSFVRVWGMYAICVAIAIPLGIKIALSRKAYEPAFSVLQVLSAIPATILLPIIVIVFKPLLFGDELVALMVIAIAIIWYLLFSIIAGMRTIPEQLLEAKNVMRLKWTQAWRRIYLPAIMPSFITGSITAIGGAWNALIVAEYFSLQTNGVTTVVSQVHYGIGKLLDKSVFSGNLPLTFLALVAMVVMVVVINRLVWQRLYNKVTTKYKVEV